MKLTDTACRGAKPKDRSYKMFDGHGLYLEVMPNGSKLWRIKYRFLGKEKRLSLGAYPLVSLAEARDLREDCRKQLAKDLDPSDAKREKRTEIVRNAGNTFQVVAQEWMEISASRWSEGYAGKVRRRMEMHLFPHIGHRPISQITPPELLECLRKVEKSGALDMASRVKEVAGCVFRYGIQTARCERDPAADLRGALKTAKPQHFRTITAADIPAFLKALERNEARLFERTRRAVKLSLLTFCRPGEIRQAKWADINLEAKLWTIPGDKMKSRRDHIVPLSRQAVELLIAQKEETGHINTDNVFPSQVHPRRCMSDGTVNRAIERLGFGETMVAHGIRALARTTLREKLGYDGEIIEKQLAHKTRNPLGESYDRTQFLPQRKEMMQHWADYLDNAASSEGTVVSVDFKMTG